MKARNSARPLAFTLRELLVVPALGKARDPGQAFPCVRQIKPLPLAWQLHAAGGGTTAGCGEMPAARHHGPTAFSIADGQAESVMGLGALVQPGIHGPGADGDLAGRRQVQGWLPE